MFCNKCGTQRNEGSNFCASCGNNFNGTEQPIQQSIQQSSSKSKKSIIFAIIAVVLVILIGIVVVVVLPNNKIKGMLEESSNLLRKDDYEGAILICDQILELDEDNFEAYELKKDIYIELLEEVEYIVEKEDEEEILELLEKIIELEDMEQQQELEVFYAIRALFLETGKNYDVLIEKGYDIDDATDEIEDIGNIFNIELLYEKGSFENFLNDAFDKVVQDYKISMATSRLRSVYMVAEVRYNRYMALGADLGYSTSEEYLLFEKSEILNEAGVPQDEHDNFNISLIDEKVMVENQIEYASEYCIVRYVDGSLEVEYDVPQW